MESNPDSTPQMEKAAPRADAARNRAAILVAATELFATQNPESVSMDAIAERAGVGKPTLYRHFGDRAGLAHAVFEGRERAFQEAVIRGQGPFAPSASPAERIAAFLDGYLLLVGSDLDLLLAAETARPSARFEIGAYASYHRLLSVLLWEAGVADRHLDYLANLLLATTAADFYQHLCKTESFDGDRIRSEACHLAHQLVAAYTESG